MAKKKSSGPKRPKATASLSTWESYKEKKKEFEAQKAKKEKIMKETKK